MRRTCLILMFVALMVGASGEVVLAGHAFNDPMATTGPGDFWCSGDMDVDGTGLFDGVCTFNADAIFALDVAIRAELTVLDLTVTNDVSCDSLYVGSNLTVVGALEGARDLIVFDSSSSNRTTDEWLFTGKISGSLTRGLGFIHDGSIIGITGGVNIDSYTPTATLDVTVYLDGVEECQARWTIDDTGWKNWHATFTRGDHTFTADQFLSVDFDVTGTAQWDYPTCGVEIQNDD